MTQTEQTKMKERQKQITAADEKEPAGSATDKTYGTVTVNLEDSFMRAVMAYSLVTTEELALPTTLSSMSTTSSSVTCTGHVHCKHHYPNSFNLDKFHLR